MGNSATHDKLGDRMKDQYENRTRFFLPRRTYTILRVDGRAFHTFTRGLTKPYDTDFMACMDAAAIALCKEVAGARFAFVQSDEISVLATDFEAEGSQSWFDGNVQKWTSIAASTATAAFNLKLMEYRESALRHDVEVVNELTPLSKKEPTAQFDARVFSIPDYIEVENYFLWRQQDAARNSVTLLASNYATHKQLNGVSTADRHNFIHAAGDNWAKHPVRFKHGAVIRKMEPMQQAPAPSTPTLHKNGSNRPQTKPKTSTTPRTKWGVDEKTPSFSRDRAYLRNMIPRHWENDTISTAK